MRTRIHCGVLITAWLTGCGTTNDGALPGDAGVGTGDPVVDSSTDVIVSDDAIASSDATTTDAVLDGNPDDAAAGPPVKWASVTLGGTHACALNVDGVAYCWGFRADGNCGDGEPNNTDLYWRKPHPVAGGYKFKKLSAGGDHTCGITDGQKLYCWGTNNDGQIGDGGPTGVTANKPEDILRFTPVLIRGDLTFAAVSAGPAHTCALDTSGKGYCWGDNEYSQTGVPSSSYQVETPTLLDATDTLDFQFVAVGGLHSCALITGGSGYCWGNRGSGQLGDGVSPGYPNPSSPSPIAGDHHWSEIATELSHTCAIESETKAVYCWGSNTDAELGVEPTTDALQRTLTPMVTSSGFTAIAVTVLNGNTCAIAPDGAAYCWGMDDGTGVFANGEEFSSGMVTHTATPQLVTGGHVFTNISGNASMVCGTTSEGSIYCWGDATSERFTNAESYLRNATPRKLVEP